jgi:hypothetical protein
MDALARLTPSQESSSAPVNRYATPQVNLQTAADSGVEELCDQTYSQIQGKPECSEFGSGKSGQKADSDD